MISLLHDSLDNPALRELTDAVRPLRPRGYCGRFTNAVDRLAEHAGSARDGEVLADDGGSWTIHCWLVDAKGRHWDPSFPDPERRRYRGVVFGDAAELDEFVDFWEGVEEEWEDASTAWLRWRTRHDPRPV